MDGRQVSKTTYADLYAVIGDTQGTSTDSTKFVIADMTDGRYLMGSTVAGGRYSEKNWTQPLLSTNGVLGGNSFAVHASSDAGNVSYPIYKAFDGNLTSHWRANAAATPSSCVLTFYNPTPLRVTNFAITNRSDGSNTFDSGDVQGSNDNTKWTYVCDFTNTNHTAGATWMLPVNNTNKFFKYWKITPSNVSGSDNTSIAEIKITATYIDEEDPYASMWAASKPHKYIIRWRK